MLGFNMLFGSEKIVNRYTALAIVSAGLSLGVPVVSAATQAIGVAMSEGTILVNDAKTPGNTTIFNGSTLQTQQAASQVRMKDGAQVSFNAESRGKLFTDHVDLQQGSAKFSSYSATANGLSVRADAASSASVAVKGNVVEVAALTGNIHVFNAEGMNVANLLPGRALDLSPSQGVNTASSLTGCPVKSGNSYLLTDEASVVTVQLRGGDIKPGTRVQITGSMIPNVKAARPATQVLAVNEVKEVGGRCAPVVPAKFRSASPAPQNAGATAPAASGTGAGTGVSHGVIIGVGVAAAAGVAIGAAYGVGALGSGVPCVATSAQPCPH
jgi:hypothetical protein